MIGQTIGNILVTEKLGEGGMGVVYKGVDTTIQRDVAIKILLPTLVNKINVVERFRQEGITLGKLNHANIATLYSLIPRQNQNDYCMIMEYVHGLRLDQITTLVGPLPFQYASRLIVQALDGLEHANKYLVVHRDIKPGNLIITAECNLKIMDFGLARAIWTSKLTQDGTIMGTFAYMSPEQIRGGNDLDSRSDLYSLGIVFYEMLTGKVPFQSESAYELMRLHNDDMPLSPRNLCADIPPEIEEIILKSLSKNPADRFNSPAEFRNKLMPYQASQDELFEYLGPVINEHLVPKSPDIANHSSSLSPARTNSNSRKRRVNGLQLLIGGLFTLVVALSIIAVRVSKSKPIRTTNPTSVTNATPYSTPVMADTPTYIVPTPTASTGEAILTDQWKKFCESCDDRLMPLLTPQGAVSQALTPQKARNQFCSNVNKCNNKSASDKINKLINELSSQ